MQHHLCVHLRTKQNTPAIRWTLLEYKITAHLQHLQPVLQMRVKDGPVYQAVPLNVINRLFETQKKKSYSYCIAVDTATH